MFKHIVGVYQAVITAGTPWSHSCRLVPAVWSLEVAECDQWKELALESGWILESQVPTCKGRHEYLPHRIGMSNEKMHGRCWYIGGTVITGQLCGGPCRLPSKHPFFLLPNRTPLWYRHLLLPDEETQAQRAQLARPRSHNLTSTWSRGSCNQVFRTRSSDSQPTVLSNTSCFGRHSHIYLTQQGTWHSEVLT